MARIGGHLVTVLGLLLPPLGVTMEVAWDETQRSLGEEEGFLSEFFANNIFLHERQGDGNASNPLNISEDGDIASNSSEGLPITINSTEDMAESSSSTDELDPGPRTCGLSFNATSEGCSRRIAQSGRSDCDCYSFCGDTLTGCYFYGEDVPDFTCPLQDVAVGCHENFTDETVIIPEGGIDEPCPRGYICSKYEQQSCEVVRQIPIWLGLGDVHAGLYCPGRENRTETGYENCGAGYYCKDSEHRDPCPEGYFCPHKTEKPDTKCRGCHAGATTLAREFYAYMIVALVAALMVILVLWQSFRRYNEIRYNQLRDLKQRNLDGIRDVGYKRKHLKKMKALRSSLKVIEMRLRQQYGYNYDEKVVIVNETEDGKVTFDAAVFFDVLDTRDEDVLPYRKLNRFMKLNNVQLREFAHRMNDAAGEPRSTLEVERHIFITQFLPVYGAVDQLDPRPEDAALIFDEIAKHHGTTNTGEIPHRFFYTSRLAEFLTEEQINTMLKDFQRTKEFNDGDDFRKDYEPKKQGSEDPKVNKVPIDYRRSFFGLAELGFSVGRSEFIARYPTLLAEATKSAHSINSMFFSSQLAMRKGIDLTFKQLSVSVDVKDRAVRIITNVSGRLCAGTMTALMGGPGSGKRSLLTALSGRSFFGKVSGRTLVNGHKSSLVEHASLVGFVPKEDALYEDLTVREHLIFSGKFRGRESITLDEIEDLAEAAMASFNLSSIMHTLVGHIRHGKLSSLQRRSLSIAMEIMGKPRILFLENPMLGLDATSALIIARALKKLVDYQGVTICCTLHQPRKECLELFGSLLMLGIGGKLVYNGPVRKVTKYFNKLNYYLHDGESLTDWLVDIATGKLKPPVKKKKQHSKKKRVLSPSGSDADTESEGQPSRHQRKRSAKKVMFAIAGKVIPPGGGKDNMKENIITKPFDSASEQAKATCDMLCDHWREHMVDLSSEEKHADYYPPEPYALPRDREKTSFLDQLGYQLQRQMILAERNWFPRFLDTTIIVVAVLLISRMDGVAQPTAESDLRGLNYENIAHPTSADALLLEFPKLFEYAIAGVRDDIEAYATKVGVIFALVVCITSTKKITVNRTAFFREAGSGYYSSGAFFLAINILATTEHSIQAMIASMFAFSIRNSLAMWYTYVVNFLLLSWISTSWGLLFPLLIPKDHVVSVAGFLVIFFGLLFCGSISPISFQVIYENVAAAIASALLSPTRFFVEAMAVAEARSLPGQSGFTELGPNIHGEALNVVSFEILSYGLRDFGEITKRSSRGWYWAVLPSLFVGLFIRWLALGALYGSNRSRQGKKPLLGIAKRESRVRLWFFAYMAVLLGLLAATLFFVLRDSGKSKI